MKNLDRSAMSAISVCAAIAVAAPHHAYAEEPSVAKVPSDSSAVGEASPRQPRLKSLQDLADACRIYLDAIRRKIKHPDDEMVPEDAPGALRKCSQELIGLRGAIRDLYQALYDRLSDSDELLRLFLEGMSRYWGEYESLQHSFLDVPYGHELNTEFLKNSDVQPLLAQLADLENLLSQMERLETHDGPWKEHVSGICSKDLKDMLGRFDELEALIMSLESQHPQLSEVTEWDQAKNRVRSTVLAERRRVRELLGCEQPVTPVIPPRTTGDRGSFDNKKK